MTQDTQNLDLFGEGVYKVRMCPVCGSTDLVADILTSVTQEPDGQWNMAMVKPEDILHEMTNPNTELRCANTQCGNPRDGSGIEILLQENQSLVEYWMVARGYTSEDDFESLSDDEKAEFAAWESELYWNTWSGVIGDCHTL